MTYHLSTLPNGLRVACERLLHVESVAVAVSVDVGARWENEREHGMSHLLEHMAFKGTKSRSAKEIAEAFDAIGGQFNAYTSLEHTVYYTKVLSANLPLAMEILSDILLNSVFDTNELKREQGVVCQEIAMHHDTPDDLIFDLFDEAAFPAQPLGRTILGTPEGVQAYGREDVIAYMRAHYTAPRMVLSAAGKVDYTNFVSLAERYFGALPAGAERPPAAPGVYAGGEQRRADELEQLQLLLGLPAVSVHDPDYYALQIFSGILGGGMSSRLFQEVREKRGLAYHVSSMVSAYRDCGMLTLYSATGEEQSAELPLILADELKRMAESVRETELLRVKQQQKAELLMAKESPGTVAGWIGKHLLVYGEYRTLEDIIARINAVTRADLKRIGERLLKGAPTMAALGPTASLPDYAAVAGRLRT